MNNGTKMLVIWYFLNPTDSFQCKPPRELTTRPRISVKNAKSNDTYDSKILEPISLSIISLDNNRVGVITFKAWNNSCVKLPNGTSFDTAATAIVLNFAKCGAVSTPYPCGAKKKDFDWDLIEMSKMVKSALISLTPTALGEKNAHIPCTHSDSSTWLLFLKETISIKRLLLMTPRAQTYT